MISEARKRWNWSDFADFPVKIEAFLCLLPLLFIRGYSSNHKITTAYIFCIFVLLIFKKIYFKQEFYLPHFIPWVFLIIWHTYILSKSPSFTDATQFYTSGVIGPFLLFIVFSNIDIDEFFLKNLVHSLIFSGVILSFGSLYFYSNNDISLSLRISSFWESQNVLSTYLMIVFLFNFSILINNRKDPKAIFYLISLLLILFGIFLTQTRATWIAILIAILFYIVKKPKVIIPVGLFFGIFAYFFLPVIRDRFLSVQNFTQDLSSIGRLQAWYTAFLLIKDNLWLGYGYDSFIHLRDSVLEIYLVPVIHSHNTYLTLMLESGLIGFIIYFFFVVKAIIYSFTVKIKNPAYKIYLDALQMSFVGLLLSFMFEPYFAHYDNSSISIWLLICLAFAFHRKFIK